MVVVVSTPDPAREARDSLDIILEVTEGVRVGFSDNGPPNFEKQTFGTPDPVGLTSKESYIIVDSLNDVDVSDDRTDSVMELCCDCCPAVAKVD